jgi:hypothetical protein
MRLISALALSAALFVPAAFSQTVPACDGNMAVVRVSEIKPDSMNKFIAAVAAQKDWYATHSLPDKIFATKILDRASSTYSTTEAMTYHFYGSGTPSEPKHDAGFDAFVKLFSEASTIKATYLTCIPKGMSPM